MSSKFQKWSIYLLRFGLAGSFLAACADRFGWCGGPGSPYVGWGNFENFTNYTAKLNWFLPASFIPSVAWIATILEIVLALLLIVGFKVKETAFASGVLLALFCLAMTVALGIKAPLEYSVFTTCGAAFLLSSVYNQTQKIKEN